MFILSQNLKHLKNILRSWNKQDFGNIHNLTQEALNNLNNIQAKIDVYGLLDAFIHLEKFAHLALHQALCVQDLFWKEKFRI